MQKLRFSHEKNGYNVCIFEGNDNFPNLWNEPDRKKKRIYEHHFIWILFHPNDIINKNQIIHHVNGNRSDNRIENLQKLNKDEHKELTDGMRGVYF